MAELNKFNPDERVKPVVPSPKSEERYYAITANETSILNSKIADFIKTMRFVDKNASVIDIQYALAENRQGVLIRYMATCDIY